MSTEFDYLNFNLDSWNKRTQFHIESKFYDIESFINGKSSLNQIELDLLGDIKGKSILHLQCHFGLDSMSLSRKGANVTGVDFSDIAITKAKDLSKNLELESEFICSDIYDLNNHLAKKFDIVYTTYGTIGWLPDLNKWAKLISSFLKPGGKLIFVEFHPVVWMFDNDFKEIQYRYFKSEPIVETETGTYADRSANMTSTSVTWNYSLGEVFEALIKNNLSIETFNEYDYSPYNCFSNCIQVAEGKFRISHFGDKIPMVYSLTAIKN
jgi:2-polyprenyl-3-methyl-5-hydroxy-6-metoxy-1,4-benzoquinol methylase